MDIAAVHTKQYGWIWVNGEVNVGNICKGKVERMILLDSGQVRLLDSLGRMIIHYGPDLYYETV